MNINTEKEIVYPSGRRGIPGPEIYHGYGRHGHNPVTVTCPYCDTDNHTMLWSLAGSGKRCAGCFALLGQTVALRPTPADLHRLRKDDPRRALWPAPCRHCGSVSHPAGNCAQDGHGG